jgi:hypothetical protein
MIEAGVFRKHNCRATEFTLCGMRALTVENESLRVTVLLDKGADIIEFRDKRTDLDVLWASPAGLRAPFSALPTAYNPDGNYLDFYEGGWQELFPSIGDPAEVRGAKLGTHGEACLLPWSWRLLQEDDERVSVELSVRMLRTPFTLTKALTIVRGKRALWIDETAVNTGGVDLPLMWGHHPALGGPFLDGELYLDIPAAEGFTFPTSFHPDFPASARFDWPRVTDSLDVSKMPALPGKWAGICCATKLNDGWCALTNPALGKGFALAFDKTLFPNVWLWLVYEGMDHYPWYGKTRCVAMEPYSSVPDNLREAVRQNTARTLRAGERLTTGLCAVLYDATGRVARVQKTGDVILREDAGYAENSK